MNFQKKKKEIKGIVISNKMNKTIIVNVFKYIKHLKYKKFIKNSFKYFVHDEKNECCVGDIIIFKEVAPISKKKNWKLCSIIKKTEVIS